MNAVEALKLKAHLALLLIMRTQNLCGDELRGKFQEAERRLSKDPRIGCGIDFANRTVAMVVRSDPDADANSALCYDFLKCAIEQATPRDPSLQIDLCDSLIALGNLQALAIEDVIGDGEFEPVGFFRKNLDVKTREALEKSGGPMADLLL